MLEYIISPTEDYIKSDEPGILNFYYEKKSKLNVLEREIIQLFIEEEMSVRKIALKVSMTKSSVDREIQKFRKNINRTIETKKYGWNKENENGK